MQQTTLSVALEVKPDSAGHLAALIDRLHDLGTGGDQPGQDFAQFMAQVPAAHFLSMNMFPGADYDPLFVIEANFDGGAAEFWRQMDAAMGEPLRAMLGCCKRPLNQDGPLFDSVTQAGSRTSVVPYLERRSIAPSVFHHGNRGMTRDRILQESGLFGAIRAALATSARATEPGEVHQRLRATLLADHPWLDTPAPRRIGTIERLTDIARLALFAVALVAALSLPGLILAPVMPTARFLVLLALGLVAVGVPLYRIREPLPGTGMPHSVGMTLIALRHLLLVAMAVGGYLVVAAAVWTLGSSLFTGVALAEAWRPAMRVVALGLASAAFSITALLAWLRWLERRDSSQDDPPVDAAVMRQMAQREDWIPQNHMGSVVLLKPGMLRTAIVHAGHRALGLVLRVKATDGYLGSMRTVHFAHWAFVNNGGRLMFFSNFDQSWESYLDDFIEKAHEGLTLAWGCGVGFPATRFLIQDGASHGRKFKAWARHSMAISRFWYSAYPDLTVDQIERNNRIANGLRRPSLSAGEAAAWINDL